MELSFEEKKDIVVKRYIKKVHDLTEIIKASDDYEEVAVIYESLATATRTFGKDFNDLEKEIALGEAQAQPSLSVEKKNYY